MVCCAALKCRNRPKKGCKKSFHRFPKDKELCEMWIHNLRRENYVPSLTAVVCSDHFEDSCYECYLSPRRLKGGTVPTVFHYPPNLSNDFQMHKFDAKVWRPNQSQEVDSIELSSGNNEPQPNNSSSTPTVIEHSYAVEGDAAKVVIDLKRKLINAQDELIACRRKLKTDKQRVRRFKKKISVLSEKVVSLEETVKTLKSQSLITSAFDKSLQITFTEEFLQSLQ